MRYSENEKYELVKRYYDGETASDICAEKGIAKSTFYSWLKPYKTDHTDSGIGVSAAEFVKMRNRVEKLEKMVEILQKVNCSIDSPLKTKLNELEKLYGQYSVRTLCDSLNVARGTFYNHIFRNKRENTSYQMRRTKLSEKILQIYNESNQIYGAKKIKAVLESQDIHTSVQMVSELMNEMNISSIRSDSKRIYKQLNKSKKKDMLGLDFTAKRPNEIWVSDITYFNFQNTTYYICVIVDLYSRMAIACTISKKQSTQLITSTFKDAYKKRNPGEGLIFHSDRGSQYASYAFQNLLRNYGFKQSFSPSGRPCHNAVMKSFFSTMKKEELYRANYHSEAEFKERIQKYIMFYNTERPHSTLGYKTPNSYEKAFYELSGRKNIRIRGSKHMIFRIYYMKISFFQNHNWNEK